MTKDFRSEVDDVLRDRETWELEQRNWHTMRYDGIKRAVLPYKNAPDMHYPLVDTMITKLMPYYIAQIYNQDRLMAFECQLDQDPTLTIEAEKCFDYTVKQFTNFERQMHTILDYMLMYGHGTHKIYWNPTEKKICLMPIRPIYIVVPSDTEDVNKADWLIHINHLSEFKFKKLFPDYKGKIDEIKGKGNESYTNFRDTVLRREGISIGQTEKQIIVWEVYERDGDKITKEVISPLLPDDKNVISKAVGVPYKHKELPFCDYRYELQDPDYYGARGIADILAHNEMDLNKTWNHLLQWLDQFGQPTYKNTMGVVGNTSNIKAGPGRLLPQGVEPVAPQGSPPEFMNQMQLQRALAEDRVQVPDLNSSEHLTGGKSTDRGDVTATQIRAVVGQSSQGNDLRGRVFRHCQAEQAKQLWSLIVQYDECGRNISASEKAQKGAIHEDYVLKPSGSADSYNKENRVSKALTYKQILAGDPAINQSELTKYVIEADDPALVQRLWLDENMQFMKQMELAQKQGAIQGAMQQSLMQASPPMPQQGAPQGALPPGGDPSQQMMLPPGGDPMAGGMPPAMPPQVGPDGMPLPPVDPSMMGGGMPMVGPGGAMIPGPNGQSIIIQLPPLQLDPNSAAQVFQQMAASLPAPVVQNNVEPTPIQNIVQPSQVVVQPAPAPVVPPAQSQHNIVVEQPAEVDIKLIKDKHGNTTGAKIHKK